MNREPNLMKSSHHKNPTYKYMKESSVEELVKLLKGVRNGDPNVQFISLDFKLPTSYLQALLRAIPKSKVTRLSLTRTGACDQIAEALGYCLKHSSSLTEIDLSKNHLSDETCKQIASFLSKSNIKRINLTKNDITDQGVQSLCEALPHSQVTSLRLGRIQLSIHGIRAISTLIKQNQTNLTTLDLRSNDIGNAGALLLSDALAFNTTLQYLYLNQNSIDNQGVEQLAASLQTNTELRTLDLQKNPINDQGARAFVDTLHSNDNFMKLKIKNTQVSEDIKNELLDLLVINSFGPELARQTKEAAAVVTFEPATECVICFDEISDAAFLPCKHYNCCQSCASHLKACHMCRSPIVKILSPATSKQMIDLPESPAGVLQIPLAD